MKYFLLSGEHVTDEDMPIIIEYLGKTLGFETSGFDDKFFIMKAKDFFKELKLVEEEAMSDPRLNWSSRRVVLKLINTRRNPVFKDLAYLAPMSLVYKEVNDETYEKTTFIQIQQSRSHPFSPLYRFSCYGSNFD